MNHRSLFRTRPAALLALLVLGLGTLGRAAATEGAPAETFRYDTGRTAAVEIALADSAGQPALLSFYSHGPNGLRLLENVFTGAAGDYRGNLRLPAHLDAVVLVVRTAERHSTLTLTLVDDTIVYAE